MKLLNRSSKARIGAIACGVLLALTGVVMAESGGGPNQLPIGSTCEVPCPSSTRVCPNGTLWACGGTPKTCACRSPSDI